MSKKLGPRKQIKTPTRQKSKVKRQQKPVGGAKPGGGPKAPAGVKPKGNTQPPAPTKTPLQLSTESQTPESKAQKERTSSLIANLESAHAPTEASNQPLNPSQVQTLQDATGWSPEQTTQLQGQKDQSPYFAGQTDDGRGYYVSQGPNSESGDPSYTLHTAGDEGQMVSSPLEHGQATRSSETFFSKEKGVMIINEAGEQNPTFSDIIQGPDGPEFEDHSTQTTWFNQ